MNHKKLMRLDRGEENLRARCRRVRILAVVDDSTRECPALVVDTSLSGARVARAPDAVMPAEKPARNLQASAHQAGGRRRAAA